MTSVDLSAPLLPELANHLAPVRTCGTCTLCCKVLAVEELNKPRSKFCGHCVPGQGCSIHATRPTICRQFFCNWLLLEELGPEWKPERSHLILHSVFIDGHQGLHIHVDTDFPNAWREPPFYQNIKQWAGKIAKQSTGPIFYVLVEVGPRRILVLPDRDVDFDTWAENEEVRLPREVSPTCQRCGCR